MPCCSVEIGGKPLSRATCSATRVTGCMRKERYLSLTEQFCLGNQELELQQRKKKSLRLEIICTQDDQPCSAPNQLS